MKYSVGIVALLLAFSSTTVNLQSSAQSKPLSTQCVVGRTSPPTGFWTWPANSEVSVFLREPDFSQEYSSAVRIAVENWNDTAVENGSHVRFTFRGLTTETKKALGDLTIARGDVYDKKIRHLALLRAHSLRGNQLIDYGLIVVDNSVQNPDVLTNVMAHELGHSLGLLDCYECRGQTTAMGLLKTAKEANGIEGPTLCDILAVQTAYRELAVRIGRMPAEVVNQKGDDGEEPEADDTPIIKPPR